MDKKSLHINSEPLANWFEGINEKIIISGPCSAETEQQVMETATLLKQTGKVHVYRAGIWKPRTHPNEFEGIGSEGLQWLRRVKQELNMPVSTEVANAKHVYEALKYGVDLLWIGARTTASPFTIQEIADTLRGVDVPVLIKNPVSRDLELWIGAIERIHMAGIKKIGAIHRGFSSWEKTKYRNLPQWQIPIELKRIMPDLPIVCDPSHICGNRELLHDVSQQAYDLNFSGLMIESHLNPDKAWSDAKQQLTPENLGKLISSLVERRENSLDNNYQHKIELLRKEIDVIDNNLLDLFQSRMNAARNIGRCKKEGKVSILQTSRWNEIIETMKAKGEAKGLDHKFIENIFSEVHQESIRLQAEIMNQ